jgi:hypothetical protein
VKLFDAALKKAAKKVVEAREGEWRRGDGGGLFLHPFVEARELMKL